MHTWPQRMLVLGAVLAIACAAIVVLLVIPPVLSDTFPLAAPARAAGAFRIGALLSALAGVAALIASRTASRVEVLHRVLRGIAGAAALLLVLAFVDAAGTLAGHGPAMRVVAVTLWVAAAIELVAAASIVGSAYVRRAAIP